LFIDVGIQIITRSFGGSRERENLSIYGFGTDGWTQWTLGRFDFPEFGYGSIRPVTS
jgi:hypothetical protein